MVKEISKRLKWVQLYAKTQNTGLTCRRCGISRPTLRKWVRRYEESGLKGLQELHRRPSHSSNIKVDKQIEAWVMALSHCSRRDGRITMYLFSIMPEAFKELSFAESVKYEDYDLFCWNGESRLDNWTAPNLAWLNDEFTNASDPKPDITAISGIFAVNERAYQVLKYVLAGQVEFLPTVGPDVDSQWRLLNITNYLGLLEPAKSIYEIYDDGEVGMCQHRFLNEPSQGNRIFGVKEYAPNVFIDEETKCQRQPKTDPL